MDKKSKILLWVFGLLILTSVGVTFWRIVIKKDYIIESQIDCDPYADKCFIWKCDPNSTVEGEACTGDAEKDIWYYELAKRNAGKIPLCDPENDENCDPWTCEENEKDCEKILCDEQTKQEQGVECNNPEQYALDNPQESEEGAGEEAVCQEGDEECLSAQETGGEEEVCQAGAEGCEEIRTDSAE